MAKMRVRELAKELDIKSADIVTALSEKGVEVLPASSIEDDNIEYVKKKFAQKGDGTSSDEDAKKICEAVNEMKDFVTQIIVHCEAGVSRSAGVAAAIGKYLNGDDMFIFGAPRFSPNITCYRKVLNTFMNENVPLDLDKIKFSNEVFSKGLIYSRTEEEYKELFFNNEEELNKWVLDRSSI